MKDSAIERGLRLNRTGFPYLRQPGFSMTSQARLRLCHYRRGWLVNVAPGRTTESRVIMTKTSEDLVGEMCVQNFGREI